jgi:hypothetical protein
MKFYFGTDHLDVRNWAADYGGLKELKKTLVHYGCGPSTHVVFSNPVKDNSDIIVKTTVKDLKTGNETTYQIIIDDRSTQLKLSLIEYVTPYRG